jgi:G3E family GTPase
MLKKQPRSLRHDKNLMPTGFHRQVALADLVIVNKQDLVTANEIAAIQELIGEINPLSTIIHSTHSEYQLGFID